MRKFFNAAQSVLEYVLSGLFLFGTYQLIGMEAIEPTGVFVVIFGGMIALKIYMVWFTLIALSLIYAKVRGRKRLHKNTLLAMYLTCAYTASLSVGFYGFDIINIIDDLIIGAMAALFWLRWKFRTEYVDPTEWDHHRIDLDKPKTP